MNRTASSRKRTKIPTSAYLAHVALHYLGRFAASEQALRRVLTNRLRRAGLRHPAFAEDEVLQQSLRQAIETIIAEHRRTGALNDVAYAETKIANLRRAGRSRQAIAQKLAQKGVARDHVAAAWQSQNDGRDAEESERQAARRLAERRKLGPFRHGGGDAARRRKDLAILARAGFSSAIARAVLESSDEPTASEAHDEI